MLRKILAAGALLAASTAPGFAAWNVIQDASSMGCYAANRPAGPSEFVLEGNFGSQQQAHARIDQISACDRALDDTDTDS